MNLWVIEFLNATCAQQWACLFEYRKPFALCKEGELGSETAQAVSGLERSKKMDVGASLCAINTQVFGRRACAGALSQLHFSHGLKSGRITR